MIHFNWFDQEFSFRNQLTIHMEVMIERLGTFVPKGQKPHKKSYKESCQGFFHITVFLW